MSVHGRVPPSIALAVALSGCILPVSTGAPLPATTVGQGKVGVAIAGEAPVLDLIANNTGSGGGSNSYTSTYGESPAAAATLTFAYGLGPDSDLEISGEGALYYFILPLPTGASIGLRQHLFASETVDVAIAGRIGGVTTGSEKTDSSGQNTRDDASALYGAIQGVVQLHTGRLRPMAALNLMPFRITRALENEPVQKFKGFASSLTIGLMIVTRRVQIGPYVTVTDFESQQFSGGQFVSGGLMFAFRQDRSYVPPAPQVMTPAPPPPYAPYGPPASDPTTPPPQ